MKPVKPAVAISNNQINYQRSPPDGRQPTADSRQPKAESRKPKANIHHHTIKNS
jgi:hypothetical protein